MVPAVTSSSSQRVPQQVADWPAVLASSRSLFERPTGAQRERLVVVEYSDLQCPACRMFHETVLPELEREFGDRVDFRLAHFPLPSHPASRTAAMATECAATQGRFGAYVAAAFSQQTSFARGPWVDIATQAGVPNRQAFKECIERADTTGVASSFERAKSIGLRETPSVLVNGWRDVAAPTADALRGALKAVLDTMRFRSDTTPSSQ